MSKINDFLKPLQTPVVLEYDGDVRMLAIAEAYAELLNTHLVTHSNANHSCIKFDSKVLFERYDNPESIITIKKQRTGL